METLISAPAQCYHCGNDCPDSSLVLDDKNFCCDGCKTVYSILNGNQLCQYYDIARMSGQNKPGSSQSQKNAGNARLEFLEHPDIIAQLLEFSSDTVARVTFYMPAIHCSSCLWLLEHLYRINPAIQQTRVDFLKKQVHLAYNPTVLSLRQVVELLSSIGYEPLISLNDVVKADQKTSNRPFLYRLGVAGFCAGNIMLFSFPEYLGLEDATFKNAFGIINLLLAIPVVFYCASDYFTSVWVSLRKGVINLDFPILLGILAAFFRGTYEVLVLHGAGYFDSLAGLVFFLLCGKWFQQRTHEFLSFERDYKSYFPLAVTVLKADKETALPVAQLRKGDRIRVRHHELIPADGMLYKGQALIDYSFVTGESEPEPKQAGSLLYAGGRQVGEAIELEVVREVSQSYLTQLWNNDAFRKNDHSRIRTFADTVGKYFTLTVVTLATLTALYWYLYQEPGRAINAFTAVLIIACPCALSLSYPFALGNGLRLLGKRHLYLKNAEVIEQMAACDTIVFDKTGTLTEVKGQVSESVNRNTEPEQVGIFEKFSLGLSGLERAMALAVVRQSAHPLSRKLSNYLSGCAPVLVDGFTEVPGQGVQAVVDGQVVKLGSRAFVSTTAVPFCEDTDRGSWYPRSVSSQNRINSPQTETLPLETEIDPQTETTVHFSISHEYRGYFSFKNTYRPGLNTLLTALQQTHKLFLLSGDNDQARAELTRWFPGEGQMHFSYRPAEKLAFVEYLQSRGHRVIMVGDGLNDAGALKQANVGIAVTDDTIQFTPSSDAILEAPSLMQLPQFLRYSRYGMRVVRFSFAVSLIYNFIGLSYALTGNLSPIVAAILMPVSSATMLAIATLGMRWRGVR